MLPPTGPGLSAPPTGVAENAPPMRVDHCVTGVPAGSGLKVFDETGGVATAPVPSIATHPTIINFCLTKSLILKPNPIQPARQTGHGGVNTLRISDYFSEFAAPARASYGMA
jgi:hypothetical protein